MTINVSELNKVESKYEMRRPSSLDLDVILTVSQMETIFYQIWEYVEDRKLEEWIKAEGYILQKI